MGSAEGLASSPEARCSAAKARAAATVVSGFAACHARNQLAGGTLGPKCFQDVAARLGPALARADRIGPCGGDHDYLGELAFSACLVVPNGQTRCNAAKIRAAGALTAAKLRCLARNAGRVDPGCFAAQETRYTAAFARAERDGACPGTPDYFAAAVDRCLGLFVVALSCGNGVIDAGEQCDGQIFCTARECRIVSEIACCQVGTPPNAICADVFPEMCDAGGFQTAPGFCAGTPVPAICPGCRVGGCEDPPIALTPVCCQQSGSCEATMAATTVELEAALLTCVGAGGQPVLGGCGADHLCAPGL